MPNRLPLPLTRAILLADTIISEAGTNKKSLIGVYSRIIAPRVPVNKMLNVYVQLADAQGQYDFDLQLLHLESEEILSGGQFGPVVANDRLAPLDLVMHLPCRFSEHGEYEFRMLYEGQVFASRVFGVIPPPPGAPSFPPFDGEEDDPEEESL